MNSFDSHCHLHLSLLRLSLNSSVDDDDETARNKSDVEDVYDVQLSDERLKANFDAKCKRIFAEWIQCRDSRAAIMSKA